jgi:hypothetical protein
MGVAPKLHRGWSGVEELVARMARCHLGFEWVKGLHVTHFSLDDVCKWNARGFCKGKRQVVGFWIHIHLGHCETFVNTGCS